MSSTGTSVVRLVRVLRVVRLVGFLERLNLLVEAFLVALQDIIWVFVLVIILLYVFGILANSLFGDSESLSATGFDTHGHFGTVTRSMMTLFQVMTFDSWMSAVTRPVGNEHPEAFVFFILFALLASLGMLNLLTAIFVESLAALTQEGAMQEKKDRKVRKELLAKFIRDVFNRFDIDGSGTLDADEIHECLQAFDSEEYRSTFEKIGLTADTIKNVMSFCDLDNDGTVEYEELCLGIASMEEMPEKRDTWEIISKATSCFAFVLKPNPKSYT